MSSLNRIFFIIFILKIDLSETLRDVSHKCKFFFVVLELNVVLQFGVSLTVLTVPGYDVRVNRQPVMEGCNAVLSCTAREDVKEHLTVTSWFRDDAILLPGNTDTGE